MQKYKIHEDKAIADIAIEAFGKDINELFENAAFAISDLSANLEIINNQETKTLIFENSKVEDLLFDFLSEIIYIKDTDSFIFKNSSVKIEEKNGKYFLEAKLSGEKIDRERHELKADIKAITFHMFKIEKMENKWNAFFVVDV